VDVGEGKGVGVRRRVGVEVIVGVDEGAIVGVMGVLVKALSGKVSCPDGTQPVRKIVRIMLNKIKDFDFISGMIP
jgi:hypothetical protein